MTVPHVPLKRPVNAADKPASMPLVIALPQYLVKLVHCREFPSISESEVVALAVVESTCIIGNSGVNAMLVQFVPTVSAEFSRVGAHEVYRLLPAHPPSSRSRYERARMM